MQKGRYTMTTPISKRKACAWVLSAAMLVSLLPLSSRASAAEEYASAGATSFVFSNSGITATEGNYDGYKIDGTDLTINQAGTYLVSGTCSDGSITVKKGTTGVTLVLDGLDLTSSDTAPIACNKSTEVNIVAASSTTNSLTDSEKNNDETYADNTNAENAVLKCKDGSQVTLSGSGTLNITANGKNGIKSGATTDEEGTASLTIQTLTLNINAPVNDAINAEQTLDVKSGNLTIAAGDDAIHCDLTLNIGASGTTGPTINVTDAYEALEGATLNVYSGNITINCSDDCLNAANGDLTNYSFAMNLYGGTINAYTSTGDGFDSNGSLTISGGTIAVWTANSADNQPLDADGTITISGGTILAAGGSNGMGMNLTATQPYLTFGNSSGGGMGGGPGGNTNGGFPGGGRPGSTNGTSGTDQSSSDSTATMPTPPSQSNSASLFTKGTAFTIQNASGSTVFSGTAICNTNYLFFSSPDLTSGTSYTLNASGSSVGTATASTDTITGGGPGGGQPGNGGNMQPPQDGQQPPDFPGNGDSSNSGSSSGSGSNTQPSAPGTFTDVKDSDWFASAVKYAYEKGLMSGTGNGVFSPNTATNRAMIVTILYRLEGSPAVTNSSSFTDVASGTYYADAVAWAAENGIVSGYGNNKFGPTDNITREQLATILYRYAQYKNNDTTASADLSAYTDAGTISTYAKTALSWANASKLINGTSGTTLSPKQTATRAQVAQILMNLLKQ